MGQRQCDEERRTAVMRLKLETSSWCRWSYRPRSNWRRSNVRTHILISDRRSRWEITCCLGSCEGAGDRLGCEVVDGKFGANERVRHQIGWRNGLSSGDCWWLWLMKKETTIFEGKKIYPFRPLKWTRRTNLFVNFQWAWRRRFSAPCVYADSLGVDLRRFLFFFFGGVNEVTVWCF